MEAASFDESNSVLGPPPGMSLDDCNPLAVWQGPVQGASSFERAVISCWKATPEELVEINRTGRIWLICIGGMPPVMLTGNKPEFPKT